MIDLEQYPEKLRKKLRKYPDNKRCVICEKPLTPSIHKHPKGDRLERVAEFLKKRTCSRGCASTLANAKPDDVATRIADVEEMLAHFRKYSPGSIYCQEAEHRLKELRA